MLPCLFSRSLGQECCPHEEHTDASARAGQGLWHRGAAQLETAAKTRACNGEGSGGRIAHDSEGGRAWLCSNLVLASCKTKALFESLPDTAEHERRKRETKVQSVRRWAACTSLPPSNLPCHLPCACSLPCTANPHLSRFALNSLASASLPCSPRPKHVSDGPHAHPDHGAAPANGMLRKALEKEIPLTTQVRKRPNRRQCTLPA